MPKYGANLPDAREKEVLAQLKRPSFIAANRTQPSYLLFSDLAQHCDAICRFGTDHRVLDKIVKTVQGETGHDHCT